MELPANSDSKKNCLKSLYHVFSYLLIYYHYLNTVLYTIERILAFLLHESSNILFSVY